MKTHNSLTIPPTPCFGSVWKEAQLAECQNLSGSMKTYQTAPNFIMFEDGKGQLFWDEDAKATTYPAHFYGKSTV